MGIEINNRKEGEKKVFSSNNALDIFGADFIGSSSDGHEFSKLLNIFSGSVDSVLSKNVNRSELFALVPDCLSYFDENFDFDDFVYMLFYYYQEGTSVYEIVSVFEENSALVSKEFLKKFVDFLNTKIENFDLPSLDRAFYGDLYDEIFASFSEYFE